MVKPGGTGRPRLAISARLAPLPPSSSFIDAEPSALPSPKRYSHFAISRLSHTFAVGRCLPESRELHNRQANAGVPGCTELVGRFRRRLVRELALRREVEACGRCVDGCSRRDGIGLVERDEGPLRPSRIGIGIVAAIMRAAAFLALQRG